MFKSILISLLLLSAGSCAAADVSGKWSGTIDLKEDGQAKTVPAFLILKQDGSNLTGSGGGNETDQHPIRKGMVDGDNVTLEVQDGDSVFTLTLKVDGDQITGVVGKDDSPKMKISLKRVKE